MNITLTEYNDNTVMPFGKHKGEKLANVPAGYLLWLYRSTLQDMFLKQYIESNMSVLEQQEKDEKKQHWQQLK